MNGNGGRYIGITIGEGGVEVKLNKIVLISILSIAVIAIITLSVFLVSRHINNDNITYNKIVSYVSDNYEMLENFSYSDFEKIKSSNDNPETKEQKEEEILKRHLGKNTIAKSVYAYNENILEFYCGGSGFLDTGTYTGFYFSRDDMPYAFEFNNLELVEISPGVFEAQDENGAQQIHGGHKIRTEKIRDKWYYYIQYWY